MRAILNRIVLSLRLYRRNESGVTAVEFAFIAPVLFMLMFGIIEFSLYMFATSVLESAVTMSSRLGKTGFDDEDTSGISREAMIHDLVEEKSAGLLDPDNLVITTLVYSSFDNIGQPEPHSDLNSNGIIETGEYTDINLNGQYDEDMGAAGLGGPDEVVVYRVQYPWHVTTPMIGRFFSSTGDVMITTSIVVKNEPWETS